MRFRNKVVKEKTQVNPTLRMVMLYVNSRMHGLSDYLQKQSNKLSMKAKKISLFFFCLLFCSLSIRALLKGFFYNKNSIAVRSITVPAYVGLPNNDLRSDRNIISLNELEHIEAFKKYLDSLNASQSGKRLFDSIMIVRPHLLDSILFLENMYQLQSLKNK